MSYYYYQLPKRTAQTIIFDYMPGLRWGLEGEGRGKVTKMIKVFPFCFEIFHYGISFAIAKFSKLYIDMDAL